MSPGAGVQAVIPTGVPETPRFRVFSVELPGTPLPPGMAEKGVVEVVVVGAWYRGSSENRHRQGLLMRASTAERLIALLREEVGV